MVWGERILEPVMEKLNSLLQVFKSYCFPSNLKEFILEWYSPGVDQSNLQEDECSTDRKFSA